MESDSITQDLDTTYIWLDQLRDDILDASGDLTIHEEGDRDLIKDFIKDLEAIERVKHLLQEHEDPR